MKYLQIIAAAFAALAAGLIGLWALGFWKIVQTFNELFRNEGRGGL